jgi:hypothetical protein
MARLFAITDTSTLNIKDYIRDDELRTNYITIIETIYDQLNTKLLIDIMGKEIDVIKLIDSLKRFFAPFIEFNRENNNIYSDFIYKMMYIIESNKSNVS